MREMGQSAWLSTSFLTLQGSEGRVNARETGKAVRTGYYGAIFILSGRSSAKGRHTSGG